MIIWNWFSFKDWLHSIIWQQISHQLISYIEWVDKILRDDMGSKLKYLKEIFELTSWLLMTRYAVRWQKLDEDKLYQQSIVLYLIPFELSTYITFDNYSQTPNWYWAAMYLKLYHFNHAYTALGINEIFLKA